MHPLQIAFFGLFLLLMEMAILAFADGVMIAGVISMMASGDLEFGLRMFAWGALSLMMGVALGFVGKILCFTVPEEGARKLIVLSVACDVIAAGLRVGLVTGKFGAMSLFVALGIYVLGLGSYVFFLKFLAQMGDNIGEERVGRFISVIYGLFGGGFVLLFVMFFSFQWFLLLVGLEMLVSLLLYTYTIYVLFRAMPMYIQEVKDGVTDPTESAQDRRWRERKERRTGRTKAGMRTSKPAEVPKGTPPPGAKLYRVPKGIPPLHIAVKEGDRIKVEQQLAMGASPHETVRHDLTPLHIAAAGGVMEVVQVLLKAGAEINATCEEGLTPLFMAVQTGKHSLVGYMLSQGADLHHRSEHGYTPLHWACSAPHANLTGTNRVKMAEMLLEAGADLEATTQDGQTPHSLAVSNQLGELSNFLTRASGHTPVSSGASAAPSGSSKAQRPMLSDDCPGSHLCILPDSLNPLQTAVKEGDPVKVEIQLNSGGQLDEATQGGLKPIHIAAVTGVMGVADLLLRQGAAVDDLCDDGITPLFLAVAVNNQNMVGFLLSRGAQVNHQNQHGQTPLHWACGVAHPKLEGQNRKRLAETLLKAGADGDLADSQGRTARMIACSCGHDEVAALLGSSGLEPVDSPAEDDGYYE